MAGHPWDWGGVGWPKVSSNQTRTGDIKEARPLSVVVNSVLGKVFRLFRQSVPVRVMPLDTAREWNH
jgi:hypothetical protein